MCSSICRDNSVKIESCIHHGSTYVLIGKHNGDNIVLKKKKPHSLETTIEIFEGSIYDYIHCLNSKHSCNVYIGSSTAIVFKAWSQNLLCNRSLF